jgi:SAM-dependent methyltransferase
MYVIPRRGIRKEDCFFYHKMDLPNVGTVGGHWDLRLNAAEYLGHVNFHGKRVLEIGPASGFLTAWMDQSGADVVAVEQPEDAVWDFTPLDISNEGWREVEMIKQRSNEKLKNAFWFTHETLGLKAKIVYSRVQELPEALGRFDVSVLAMVLTHMRDPVQAIEKCARLTKDKLVIVERLHVPAELQPHPVMWYVPTLENKRRDTWWHFSEGFFRAVLIGMGFRTVRFAPVSCMVQGKRYPVTSIVAEW